MESLQTSVAAIAAEHGFSGAVRVDQAGETVLAQPFGLAERGLGVPNTLDTQFAVASACKGTTALTVISLVDDGTLALGTTARSLLGADLPEIDDAVTVEHLLAHRSGIGDYVDEDDDGEITDYVLPVPVHRLTETEDYLAVLDGHRQKFAPGARFSYCNSGFVVLALLVERATGTAFRDVVTQRVCGPAGLRDTAYLRSDELPGRAARGYLDTEGLRTNVLHLPVRGSGDGGLYTTVGDVHALWRSVFAGQVVPRHWVDEMVRPRSDSPQVSKRYGLGFWLDPTTDAVLLEGYDAGVSFRSLHRPSTGLTWTVVANSSDGAWPVAKHLGAVLR
ncbi:serine hydrolase domain-containing protein [Angustibacter luteus]|uniref:Serine hydrolase domain-containing protein n=1 Tax=Angustibacter luteus TaxID=658456 RepID=A0ABW1JDF2_9ACTN